MTKLTPLVKGVFTGLIMLALTLGFYYGKLPPGSGFQYLVYAVYAAGIVWTLVDFSRSPAYTGKFGELFGQGFRCFIIVILIMVTFTGIFSAVHSEFAEQDAVNYKNYLVETQSKDKTPAEINEMTATYKTHYTTSLIYTAIFGYLISGAIFTAAGSVVLLLTRRK
jgi:hypothetical protein